MIGIVMVTCSWGLGQLHSICVRVQYYSKIVELLNVVTNDFVGLQRADRLRHESMTAILYKKSAENLIPCTGGKISENFQHKTKMLGRSEFLIIYNFCMMLIDYYS